VSRTCRNSGGDSRRKPEHASQSLVCWRGQRPCSAPRRDKTQKATAACARTGSEPTREYAPCLIALIARPDAVAPPESSRWHVIAAGISCANFAPLRRADRQTREKAAAQRRGAYSYCDCP